MATASRSTAELNSLYTSTLEKWMGGGMVEDTVFEANQLIWLLSRVAKETGVYGFEMIQPLMTTKNGGISWYEYDDSLNVNSYQGPEAAKFGLAQVGGPIVITEQEEHENSSEHRRVHLLKFKFDQLLLSMAEEMNLRAFAGSGINTKSIDGLEDIIFAGSNSTAEGNFTRAQATTGITNVYGGITRTGTTGWENYSLDAASYTDALDGAAGFGGDVYKAIEKMYIICSRGAVRPDLMLMSLDPYVGLQRLMAQTAEYTREVDTFRSIQLGFDNLKFRSAVAFYDEGAVTHADAGSTTAGVGGNNIYFLNTNYMKMCVEASQDFTLTDFEMPVDSRVSIAHLLWRGQVLSTNPRYLGRIFDIPTADVP